MNEATIFLYGEVANYQDDSAESYGVISMKSLINQVNLIEDNVENLNIRINTQGGDVYEGLAIHDYIKNTLSKKYNTTTIVDGLAASAGSLIFLGGTSRMMGENSTFMIHNPWTIVGGEAKDLRKQADILDQIENQLTSVYSNYTNLTDQEIKTLLKNETWMSATEAVENGFATGVLESVKAMASININNYKMTKQKEKSKGVFEKIKCILNTAFNDFENKTITDANGNVLDFQNVAEDQAINSGDVAYINGEKAAAGEYVIPAENNMVYVIGEGGVVNSINEETQSQEENAQAQANAKAIEILAQKFDEQSKENEELRKIVETGFEKFAKAINGEKTSPNDPKNPIQNKGKEQPTKRKLLKSDK